ncbi:MAG: hypothetical protein IJ773_09770 [Lachnospiraceae bacterium]|nr:hypothetical protein [Lachnospiraceae bacterium]
MVVLLVARTALGEAWRDLPYFRRYIGTLFSLALDFLWRFVFFGAGFSMVLCFLRCWIFFGVSISSALYCDNVVAR